MLARGQSIAHVDRAAGMLPLCQEHRACRASDGRICRIEVASCSGNSMCASAGESASRCWRMQKSPAQGQAVDLPICMPAERDLTAAQHRLQYNRWQGTREDREMRRSMRMIPLALVAFGACATTLACTVCVAACEGDASTVPQSMS